MVKVKGPALSMKASGSLSNSLTFTKWKGRPAVRKRTAPTNPKSGNQLGRRAMFAFLSANWQNIPTAHKQTWQELADETNVAPYNAYLSHNMQRWHNFKTPAQAYPPAENDPAGFWAGVPTATWVEHRIKITARMGSLGQKWGFVIFASLNHGFTTAVNNAIMVNYLYDTVSHDYWWTPPSVNTWHFNTRNFSKQGIRGAQYVEFDAIP